MGGQRGCKSSISLGNQAKNLSWLQVGSAICQNAARSVSLSWFAPKGGLKISASKLSLWAGKEKEKKREMFCISTSQ